MEVAEGLEWKRIYWVRGTGFPSARYHFIVRDPPCSGWQHAFILPGAKRSTIFCPFSFESFQVRNDCGELLGAVDPEPGTFKRESILRIMNDNWRQNQSYGFSKDYDTAALVLKRLDAEVPEQLLKGGEEDTRVKGGKTVENELKKPVPRTGKRGKFLAWFLEKGGSASVREAMAEFGISRSNALSYLFLLRKDHGIGYELVGDSATIALPKGCTDPFEKEKKKKGKPDAEEDTSWLDGEAETEDEETEDDSWLD